MKIQQLLVLYLILIFVNCQEDNLETNNSYSCAEYNLNYSSNILEFLSPLFSESMKSNITKLADELWADLIENTASELPSNIIQYFKVQEIYFNLEDKIYESELLKLSIKLGISIGKTLLLNQLPLLQVFTSSLYQVFVIDGNSILAGNIQSKYQELISSVTVKISVYKNSNLLYKGLMFAGTLGIYSGLIENKFSITYAIYNNQPIEKLIDNFLISNYQSDPAYNLRKLFENVTDLEKAVEYLENLKIPHDVAFIINGNLSKSKILYHSTSNSIQEIENLQIISNDFGRKDLISILEAQSINEIFERLQGNKFRNSSTILSLITSTHDNLFNITIWNNMVNTEEEKNNGPSQTIIILLIVIALIFSSAIAGGVTIYKSYKKQLQKEHREATYEEMNFETNYKEGLQIQIDNQV